KLVGKFGVKVIHAVKHKIPVPRNALSSGNVLGSKGLTVAHKQPEGLIESANAAKMRMEAGKLSVGFNPLRKKAKIMEKFILLIMKQKLRTWKILFY
ncbi:MAG: hypothetical protein Q8S21_03510, partial [Candidatus Paracaedibacteraceae bacterium]|nr:hypothetical protein [Candidatus Paracaedibacteraceae bacterium]